MVYMPAFVYFVSISLPVFAIVVLLFIYSNFIFSVLEIKMITICKGKGEKVKSRGVRDN